MSRKETIKYTFSVEGETEKWYLEWLENAINSSDVSVYNVSFKTTVSRSPSKNIKNYNAISTDRIIHICDVEGSDDTSRRNFILLLDELKKASSSKGIEYRLGYSNMTFELWIILHKQDCNGHHSSKTEYLKFINSAFSQSFRSLPDYKKETNFKRCLERLDLSDVNNALRRAKRIMDALDSDGTPRKEYKGYSYYEENPSLSIHLVVEEILSACKLVA